MTALTRSVHAAKAASSATAGRHHTNTLSARVLAPLSAGDSSQVMGVVVEVLGEHAAAVELERTGAGQFREEIVLHGHPGWTRDLELGMRVQATGEWDLADWHQWEATERAHYLAIRGRLEFRVSAAHSNGAHSAAA